MKDQKSLQSSANASIQKAMNSAEDLFFLLQDIKNKKKDKKSMPKVRALLNELNQRVHEFNAYTNALETD